MSRTPIRTAVAAAAVLAAVGLAVLVADPAGATTTHTLPVTSTATVQNTPDDGCAPWARDTFTRTTVITAAPVAVEDTSELDAAKWQPGTYTVTITDSGTFTAQPGAKTPGDAGKTFGAAVTGTLHGTGHYTITGFIDWSALAGLDGTTYNNDGAACKADVPAGAATSTWPLKFFKTKPEPKATGILGWTWTYTTKCGAGAGSTPNETRTENEQGAVGNITGKPCPSVPPTSPAASTAPSASVSMPPIIGQPAQPSLPVTGSRAMLVAGIGAFFVAAGAAGIIVGRRRRRDVTFTA